MDRPKLSMRDFDEGFFSEEEISIIDRLFPVAFVARAKIGKRKDFFSDIYYNLKSSRKILGSIKKTLYNLSKRNDILENPLSKRT